jgi:hypothetical protein
MFNALFNHKAHTDHKKAETHPHLCAPLVRQAKHGFSIDLKRDHHDK